MEKRVFISHSSKDASVALAICNALENRGINCWIAPRDVPSGADWSTSIIKAIKEAKMILLLLSAHANKSDFVYREVERAAHHQRPILPVRIDDILPHERIELFIGVSHWLDAIERPIELHFNQITTSVIKFDQGQPKSGAEPPSTIPQLPSVNPSSILSGLKKHQWQLVSAFTFLLIATLFFIVLREKRNKEPLSSDELIRVYDQFEPPEVPPMPDFEQMKVDLPEPPPQIPPTEQQLPFSHYEKDMEENQARESYQQLKKIEMDMQQKLSEIEETLLDKAPIPPPAPQLHTE